jgi:ankyrin repeat protein
LKLSPSLRVQFVAGDDAVRDIVRAEIDKGSTGVGAAGAEAAAESLLNSLAEAYVVDHDGYAGRWYGLVLRELDRHLSAEAVDRLRSSFTTGSVAEAAVSGHAFVEGRLPTLLALLDAGMPANLRTLNYARPLLSLAAKKGTPDLAAALLRYGADLEGTTMQNETPLMCAVTSNDCAMVQFLLEQGADVTQCSGSGMDVLSVAIFNGQGEDVIAVLHEAGAELRGCRKSGYTPIVEAAGRNNAGAIRALSKLGVDLNAPNTSRSTPTPVSMALASGNFAATLALIECGANYDAIVAADLSESFRVEEVQRLRSAIAEKVIFLSSSVPRCAESVHNDQNESSGSRRSPANFSPL